MLTVYPLHPSVIVPILKLKFKKMYSKNGFNGSKNRKNNAHIVIVDNLNPVPLFRFLSECYSFRFSMKIESKMNSVTLKT